MTVHEDSVSLGTALSLQEPAFDLGGIEPCLKQQLEAVRQEMAIIMLEGLQRTADACTEICMRAVQEERQVLKVQMAQEELLFALQDEHQRFLRTLKSSSEVERPQEAKVFNLIAEEDTIFNLSSISCPDVASPLDSTDSPWDISWSALPSQTLLGSDVGVQASEEVSGHEVGVQASEDVAGHEVGVQASEDVGGHAVSVRVSQCDDACKLQAQTSEDVSGESGTVSSVSSFGMVLEAQAKLHEADELMQRALNVRESELGLSTLALSGNSERLAALRPQQRDVIDATCGEGRLDQYETPRPDEGSFANFEDALRQSSATLTECASPNKSSRRGTITGCVSRSVSPRRRNISINVEADSPNPSGSSAPHFSDDEAESEWNRRQPGEEPSPNNSGDEDDDLSVAVAKLQMQKREAMQPTRATGWRTLSGKPAPPPKQKPLPARSPADVSRRASAPIRPQEVLGARSQPPRKFEHQGDSDRESSFGADPARLRGPFRASRGARHGSVGKLR